MTDPEVQDDPQTDTQPEIEPDPEPAPSAQLVPVAESIRYRRRAQTAERRVTELQQQLDEQQRTRTALEAELASTRRRGELAQALAGRGVIDLEAAMLLAEQRLAGQNADASPADVIEQLLKDKPYLAPSSPTTATTPAAPATTIATPTQGRRVRNSAIELLRSAAQRAAGAGRGPELENYLRLRRRLK
ncbi:MAG: hypothetical protein PHU85_07555 [Phycisphaerae bacterium]|nr:hypothetical protein [Phycisphaerae bacterium]